MTVPKSPDALRVDPSENGRVVITLDQYSASFSPLYAMHFALLLLQTSWVLLEKKQ